MQTARPAAMTVVTRPTSIGPASTVYQAVSAMTSHPVAGLGDEPDRSHAGIGCRCELRVRARGALEAGIVEEAVDPSRPRRRVHVRRWTITVAQGRAATRPAAGTGV